MLIIFPGALGDLMCLAPTISAIARRHGGAEIELMAREELAQFAVGRLAVARAHSIDRGEVALLFRESEDGDGAEARRFFSVFERIYCFFSSDDPRFRRTLAAACAPGAPSFHPFRPPRKGHVAAAYLDEVGETSDVAQVTMNFLPHDLEAATRAIAALAKPKQFVAIFPGSGSPAKNWLIDKFVALARRIEEDGRAVFVLGPAENLIEKLLIERRQATLRGLPLGTVAALARMASAFVGNDSGVSHLAAASGTPGVVLFGPSAPERWRPLGLVHVIHREPIGSIEVAEVMAALRRLRHRS